MGYYSRFNGGLVSLACYFILYWGFVSNIEKKDVQTMLKTILASTLISSLYGILEHFGIDKNVWIQDVQNRVFSSFGQPNWMAAWLAAVITISLSMGFIAKAQNRKVSIIYLLLSVIIFITLLFTKSRSGLLGLLTALLSFWSLIIITQLKNKSVIKQFAVSSFIFLFLALIIGTPWTPNISEVIKKSTSSPINTQNTLTGTALEVGGTSSIEIRKIVWQGAIDVWKNYPLFGSGVETFAFSYYQFRPASHNLVSEWDFLYNKAHNEYLNFMATTGTVGIISYAILIVATCLVFLKQVIFKYISGRWNINIKNSFDESENKPFHIAMFSGYLSILVTNFFGFSVVPVNLLFYLFPAMSIVMEMNDYESKDKNNKEQKPTGIQKIAIIATSFVAILILYSIFRYWYADILYSKADVHANEGKLIDSVQNISSAIMLSPNEAIYHDELGSRYADIALVYSNQKDENGAKRFSEKTFEEISKAENLSPNNLNILRNKARVAIKLSEVDPVYILDAKKALEKGIQMAPTEAKLYYNLSLTYYRIGDVAKTIDVLKKTIELKANYKDARYAYAVILSDMGDSDQAIEQLKYILKNIDPDDSKAQTELEKLENPAK